MSLGEERGCLAVGSGLDWLLLVHSLPKRYHEDGVLST
jgi:hypothetical protein